MASRASQYCRVEPASFERRASERQVVQITRATTRARGSTPIDATLHDISIYGCKLASPRRHAAGDRLWLRLNDSLPIAAIVVWSDSGFTGCRFDEPIARALMRTLTIVG